MTRQGALFGTPPGARSRVTLGRSENRAVIHGMQTRNNGRYNGNGREWATPAEIFEPLHHELQFTIDVCATPLNAKVRRFWTEAENGLVQDWRGERCWMNPPYGREIYAWTRKARMSGAALVVGLLPASTDLAWWHDDVIAGGAEIRYIRGRVRFLTGGPYRASGFFPSVIILWRLAGRASLGIASERASTVHTTLSTSTQRPQLTISHVGDDTAGSW